MSLDGAVLEQGFIELRVVQATRQVDGMFFSILLDEGLYFLEGLDTLFLIQLSRLARRWTIIIRFPQYVFQGQPVFQADGPRPITGPKPSRLEVVLDFLAFERAVDLAAFENTNSHGGYSGKEGKNPNVLAPAVNLALRRKRLTTFEQLSEPIDSAPC
ncbi:MAG: hypothetical protein VCA36_09595 [Opitutales bacterium]